MTLYRGMDRAALDAAYDNTAAVANSAALLADFDARSARLRAAMPQHLDLRYGSAERNRIDYFAAAPTARPAPILIFIHGGYWQMRAKETFSFLAAGPLAHGIHVALPGYSLAPAITLDGIVGEVRAAIGCRLDRATRGGVWRRPCAHHRVRLVGGRASHRDDDGSTRGKGRAGDQRYF